MRTSLGLALVASALGCSCSLLVQFNDQPDAGVCDGSVCAVDDSGTLADSGSAADSARHTDARVADSAPVVPDAAADHAPAPSPCRGLSGGYYCGNDGLNGYSGSPGDLVHCVDGGVGAVTACDGGCLHIQDPFPDACDPCGGVGDGLYCGRDLKGFPSTNADFLVQCAGGHATREVACAHGCQSHASTSACYP